MGSIRLVLSIIFSCCVLLVLPEPAEAQLSRDPAVQTAYDAGVKLLEEEKYEDAIVEFAKATADDTFAEAYLGQGEALRLLEDYQAAIQSYTKARDRNQDLPRAHFGLGMCHKELGQLDLAMNDFLNAIDQDRRDPEIAANLGKLYLDIGDVTNALRTLDTAVELDPENADVYLDRGWAYTQMRQTDEGIADLRKSIELDPENHDAHFKLSNVYLFLEEYENAIEALTNTIKYYEPEESTDPDIYISGYIMRADTELKLAGEDTTPDEEREKLYEKVIEDTQAVLDEYPDRLPDSGNALYLKGRALRMLLRYGEAIKTLTEAIQMIPGGSDVPYLGEAYLKRGICWLNQEEPDLARRDFQQAASLNYEDPLPYFWVGLTYAQEEEYRKALDSYGEAIAKNPGQTSAFVNRGLAYLQEEDYQKAVDNFNEAIRLEPTESEHFYKRGVAYMWLEEYEKAFNSFQLATLFNEKNAKAFRGGAIAANRLDRGSLARQYENSAAELEATQQD